MSNRFPTSFTTTAIALTNGQPSGQCPPHTSENLPFSHHPESDSAIRDIDDYMHDYKIDLDLIWMGDRASA